MNDTPMTFGECLSSILRNNNITISRLTELMGIKSRTSIHRILNDETSVNIAETFLEKLTDLNVLKLLDSEMVQLKDALEVSKVGQDAYAARRILLPVFHRQYRLNLEIPRGFNPADQTAVWLNELFETYKSFANVKMLIVDMTSIQFASELVNLTRTSLPGFITISHIMYLGDSRSHNAATFAAAFELFNHPDYSLYGVRSNLGSTPTLPPNHIIVDKEDSEGRHYTDLIKIDTDKTFTYIADIPGNSLFAFYEYQFGQIISECPNIRRVYNQGNPIDTIMDISTQSLSFNHRSKYMIRHNFFTRMIPFEFFKKICAETNYFGMAEDDPAIIHLFELINYRYTSYYNDALKVNIFTKRGLRDFVFSGMMTDHFCYLRPFNKVEVKTILEFILGKLTHDDNFKILLLKGNYALGNLEFSYIEDTSLWIYDSYSGYNDDYYEFVFECKEILEICDDFIKNELLPNHTLPEAETIDYLKYLITII